MTKEATSMKALIEEELAHLVQPLVAIDKYTKRGPEIIVESRGCILKRDDGKELLDFMGGAVSVNVGYRRKELAEAAMARMAKHHIIGLPNMGGLAMRPRLKL